MTTLQTIGYTIALGCAVFVPTLVAFGYAVKIRSPNIAPRATARPRNVIYNPAPSDKSQDRGGPMLGWICWCLGLSYDTMLNGVPGTGTREGGLAGSMLKVNLDGIVLLRFHAFCIRVSRLACFLCMFILLPVYYTAQCYDETLTSSGTACSHYNLTDYDRTTLANVPPLYTTEDEWANIFKPAKNGLKARLYCSVFCFWCLVAYAIWLLDLEFIQQLAMRRVYYLEYDVWGNRRKELQETMLHEGIKAGKGGNVDCVANAEPHLVNREPWIPHPEQRDTVPNVSLYSVLVGGLPSLPQHGVEVASGVSVAYSKRESVDWQLSLTAEFFDHCVPNQPGFSSSVAAVTVLPAASTMTNAWRKWYSAAAKLRRLRFIREQIANRRRYDIDEVQNDEATNESSGQVKTNVLDESRAALSVDVTSSGNGDDGTQRPIYQDLESNRSYFFEEVLGPFTSDDADVSIQQAIDFGPEQTAVYSRELAQSAAPCCPYGCCQQRLERDLFDDLLRAEREATEEVHQANVELADVRQKVTHSAAPGPTIEAGQDLSGTNIDDLRSSAMQRARLPSSLGLEAYLSKNTLSHSMSREVANLEVSLENAARESVLRRVRLPNSLGLEAYLFKKTMINSVPIEPAEVSTTRHEVADSNIESSSSHQFSLRRTDNQHSSSWMLVESIVAHTRAITGTGRSQDNLPRRRIDSGTWRLPTSTDLVKEARTKLKTARAWAKHQSVEAVDSLARESTYAVVTFTSRQAAVAARKCLADGRGTGRWYALPDIPVPPLADAAVCSGQCRACCRPVTLSITERQKSYRHYAAVTMLSVIFIFYTIPLTFASQLLSQQTVTWLDDYTTGIDFNLGEIVTGFISAMIWTLFFASCPLIFKAIANFGSGASSVAEAEQSALRYYWLFMMITAFSGQLLATMALDVINNGLELESQFKTFIFSIATTVPTIAASWLNWVIFRLTITLPWNYLLMANSFIFDFLGWNCCGRLVRGGGPGGSVPYRIYVDSGVVLLCVFALAPASPLLGLASFLYFLVCEPLMRRNLIFVYRPKFDSGGRRWLFVFDLIISCLMFGSVLLVAQMVIKQALVAAILAGLPMIPILLYKQKALKFYRPAFEDAALMQTSLLDGWDVNEPSSIEKREEFRRFLVDAHKAAFTPVCLAGSDTASFLTAEPAVVIPLETDLLPHVPEPESPASQRHTSSSTPAVQHGATMRRVSMMHLSEQVASRKLSVDNLSTFSCPSSVCPWSGDLEKAE